MRKLIKVLLWIAGVIVLVIFALVSYIQLGWNKTFDAPYPDIIASSDSAIIERGRYIAFGPAHCASCHMPMDKIMAVDAGLEAPPLSGGWHEEIPGLGLFRAPNITPDPETGIGKFTDAELARTIRYSVKHNGQFLPPFMLFQGMSDEDLTAVVSFLRSQPPVKNKVEPSEYTFLAKALITFGVLKPIGPEGTPPKSVPRAATAEYGEYFAENLGNCKGCHVARDERGLPSSPFYSGGGVFPPGSLSEGYSYVSPNLTPDKATGVITEWDEEMFVDRFRGGRLFKTSPMPWGLYSRMDETDLRAIYQYLHSLDPVEHKIPRTVYMPGEALPE